MHTIKLNVGDNAYAHLMFLLKNLNTSEIQVVEDTVQDKDGSFIDMSAYKIEAFQTIQDTLSRSHGLRGNADYGSQPQEALPCRSMRVGENIELDQF